MARKRTGMLYPGGTWPDGSPRFRFRIRLADGSKSERRDVPQGMTEAQARMWIAGFQAEEDASGGMLGIKREKERERAQADGVACEGETADAWHARFLESRGEDRTSDSGYRWSRWISPRIGHRPMATITREEVEAVRDALDAAILEQVKHGRARGRLSPKTALNIWATVTTAFKAACRAKQRDLRVREDNPCANVLPPERGDSRRKEWIYPREFSTLMACVSVPIEWRELYALACFLYLRPGELYELRVRDLNLEIGDVHVTRAWDWEAREVKAPKTRNGVRHVPIPATLLPLLRRMTAGKQPDDKLVPVLEETGKERKTSETMRQHLRDAGVTSARLFADNATHMPIGFRSWRDTGITWLAIDGVDVIKMQRRAGHDTIETTMGYVKAAEDIGGLAGTPFPPLPPDLVEGRDWASDRASATPIPRKFPNRVVPTQGFEPR